MNLSIAAVSIIIAYFLEISEESSSDIDSKYLFKLGNGCKNVDIRFNYQYFEKLVNCKIIHGFLRISDLEIPKNFNTSFGDIFEVTGYVLIDRVSGLKSISQLFPNLAVIRGEILHHQVYSFVITNNDDLEIIGTGLMTHVENGNVRIENNHNLCYVESVDWMQLRKGLVVRLENNNKTCNETCSECWDEEIPQKMCKDCESCRMGYDNKCCDEECIGGCKESSDDCFACKNLVFIDGNITKCAMHEPLTFQLENRFLINSENCDEMGRTRLDDECIKPEDCPIDENHYFIDNHCSYCQNCSHINCSVVVNNIDDLKNISDCHVADSFSIINLEDSKDEAIADMLFEKFQNIFEIQNCLIIRNSSAVTDLKFLKRLKNIPGHDKSNCGINGTNFSVIIERNINLQGGFGEHSEITINDGVRVENNRNLCQKDVKVLKTVFLGSSNASLFEFQTKECNYPKINVDTLVTNNSALVLLDTEISSNYEIQLIYWKGDEEKVKRLNDSYFEIQQLEADKIYPFKIEVYDSLHKKIYSTNFHFVKTLSSMEILKDLNFSRELESIDISWKSILAHNESTLELARLFGKDSAIDLVIYVTYQEISDDQCNATKNLQLKDGIKKSSQMFSQYFLNNPSSQIKDFQVFELVNITENHINITNLENSTCYRFDIFPCIQINSLMCRRGKTFTLRTLAPMILEEKSYILFYILGSVLFIVFILIILYNIQLRKQELLESYYELSTVNRRGIEVDQWQLDRANIVQTKVLGSGEFGIVYKGCIKPNEEIFYAVKTLAPSNDFYEESFRKEAEIMRRFNTTHVVKLIGYCIKERPLLVVMELMAHGDLKKFLQRNRPVDKATAPQNSTSQSGSYSTAPVSSSALHPIRPVPQMAVEIADGMMYLSSLNFIHCDLACRNLMVHESYTIKIGDFGLARELYHTDYYKPGSRNKKIPLRWMAPEALGTNEMLPRYTSKSDVYSFGIVLFELTTFCETPYAGCLDEEVVELIKMGRTLNRPKDCDDKIYDLMQKCWRYDPDERITFKEIIESILMHYDIPKFKNVSFYHSNS